MITRISFTKFAGVAISISLVASCSGSSVKDSRDLAPAGAHPLAPIDVTQLTLTSIRTGYQRGNFTARKVVQAYLDRISTYEPAYNAFTFLNPNALDQADAIDRKRSANQPLGPLAGVPIVIKESMDFVGFPSTAGWRLLSSRTGGVDLFPTRNAIVVQRLIDADAIILGKSNIPAFSDDGTRANSSWAGPTYNAVDRALAPGASSSGTATAVEGSFALIGLGEETGGSIQNPSAAQSLVGIKPTFGLVPSTGVVPLAGTTRDTVGPIATNVRDAAVVLDVIAGASAADPKTAGANAHIPAGGYTSRLSTTALQGKRIGLYGPGWRSVALSAETTTLYARAVDELSARGAITVDDPFAGSGFAGLALPNAPYDYRGTESAAYDFTTYLHGLGVPSIDALKQRIGASPFDPGQPLYWYVETLPTLAASLRNPDVPPNLDDFYRLRTGYLSIFNQVVQTNRLDALVFPEATQAIPALFSNDVISETTVSAIDIAGLPVVTVPGGQYANGAPFSLIFVGPQWSEATLLAFAYDYEQATHHRIIPRLTH
ncbi:MAG TPA: amidase [Rudaea sp.]|nr:amidase [Rudaea sp.]